MSFNFTAGGRIQRTSGNPTATSTFTVTMWVKRPTNFTGIGLVCGFNPTDFGDGHEIYCNDPGQSAYDLVLQANYASAIAVGDDPVPLNTWLFVALVGSGANISLKYYDGSSLLTETVGQTSFTPSRCYIGQSGASTASFPGYVAHIRMWNASLNDSEINAERVSETVVRATNLVSAHSGLGGDLSTALTGQSGTAFTTSGTVTYSADTPSFTSFTGTVISGEADMPSSAGSTPTGTRFNRLLYSNDMSNAVWSKQSNQVALSSVAAPTGYGTSWRATFLNSAGGINQAMSGLPVGKSVAVMAVRRVDVDFVVMRHLNSTFNAGAQGIFNLATGQWSATSQIGSVTDGVWGVRALGNGWYLIWIAATNSGDRVLEFYTCLSGTTQSIAVNRSIDVAAFQYEDVSNNVVKATVYKPTTSTVVSRTLTSATMSLSVSSIGVGQTSTATAQFLDSAGAPWDQFGPITFDSSVTADATVSSVPSGAETDLSGRITNVVTAVSTGSSVITAVGGGVTSSGATLTIGGTSVTRYVEVLVEAGWQNTAGWHVGVYEEHVSDRFPDTKLFEVAGQTFQDALSGGQSRMLVPVPTSVSVTEDQVVEVVLENDNVNGSAVDGPGIFPATVI